MILKTDCFLINLFIILQVQMRLRIFYGLLMMKPFSSLENVLEINHLYIADGHHRAASAVKVGLKRREQNPHYTGDEEFNYFLSVLFPIISFIMEYNCCSRFKWPHKDQFEQSQ